MELDPLTQVFDGSLLEGLLGIELARSLRYKRRIGLIALEPIVDPPCRDVNRPALKRLAKHCFTHTRKVDMRIRWNNSILLLLPETSGPGLKIVADKIKQSFDSEPMQHPITGLETRGCLLVALISTSKILKLLESLSPDESLCLSLLAVLDEKLRLLERKARAS